MITDSVMTSRTSTSASLQSRHLGLPQTVTARQPTPDRALIRLAAPALDLVLYAGDRVSRVVGRNEIGPDPVRRPDFPGEPRLECPR